MRMIMLLLKFQHITSHTKGQHIHTKGQWLNWDSRKAFINILLCSIVMNLQILTNTFSFLPAFLHCDKRYSSKRKFRCITIPRSFCFPFSQILLLPMFAHNNSCLCPDIKKAIFLAYFHVVSVKPLNSQ